MREWGFGVQGLGFRAQGSLLGGSWVVTTGVIIGKVTANKYLDADAVFLVRDCGLGVRQGARGVPNVPGAAFYTRKRESVPL